MENENQVDTIVSPTETNDETQVTSTPSSEKSPVEAELEKVETRKRSKLEKLEFTKKRIEDQIAQERKEQGIESNDLDKPLTLADLQAFENEKAITSALSLADDIENEHERKLTRFHLENTIKPSGDPQTDFRNARLLVESVKNKQLLEEVGRASKPKGHSSAPSAPMKQKANDELTKEETDLMKGFGLTKEQVIAARGK